MALTTKQRQHLKGLGHSLKTVIQIGKDGLNERQLKSISKALDDHELIKMGVLENSDFDKNEVSELICEPLDAELIQIVGKKILIYRKNKEKSKIVLPAPEAAKVE
jgi:RNA-binding protein